MTKVRMPAVAKKTNAVEKKQDPKKDVPQHILLRVRSDNGQTLTEHNQIILKNDSAMLGKMGKGVGPLFVEALNQQIASGRETYLFLTTREGWNGPYVTYRCNLDGVYLDLPAKKANLVPKYYAGDAKNVSTWFEISSIGKMTKADMNQITVVSSGREIMSVISSSAVVFRVAYSGKAGSKLASIDDSVSSSKTTVSNDDLDCGEIGSDLEGLGLDVDLPNTNRYDY